MKNVNPFGKIAACLAEKLKISPIHTESLCFAFQ